MGRAGSDLERGLLKGWAKAKHKVRSLVEKSADPTDEAKEVQAQDLPADHVTEEPRVEEKSCEADEQQQSGLKTAALTEPCAEPECDEPEQVSGGWRQIGPQTWKYVP